VEEHELLEARVRRLEDAERIRTLLVEYARRLDDADYAGYAELFAEDGILEAQLGQAQGREAIRSLLEMRLQPRQGAPARPKAFHLVGSPTIEIDGDSATSAVLWAYVTHDEAGFPLLLQLGHYRDELRREGERWRFRRRRISRDLGFSPLDLPLPERGRPNTGTTVSTIGTDLAAAVASLEARVERLERLEGVWRLFQDYRRLLDQRDFAGYSRLFADDGEWIGDLGRARGPAEIEALLERTLEVYPDDSTRTYHLVANPVIDVDGDQATATSTWCFVTRDERDQPVLSMLGHYDDLLVYRGGRWLFQRRVAYRDISYTPLRVDE